MVNFTLRRGVPRRCEVWFVSTAMHVGKREVNDQCTLLITTLPHPSGFHLYTWTTIFTSVKVLLPYAVLR